MDRDAPDALGDQAGLDLGHLQHGRDGFAHPHQLARRLHTDYAGLPGPMMHQVDALVGHRIKLSHTRRMVTAALSGELDGGIWCPLRERVMALADAATVFRTVSGVLGPYLRRIRRSSSSGLMGFPC